MTDEQNQRLHNLVTSYGIGTRSYNRSAEKRELDRQRKAVTESYKHEPIQLDTSWLNCKCKARKDPHPFHGWEKFWSNLRDSGR